MPLMITYMIILKIIETIFQKMKISPAHSRSEGGPSNLVTAWAEPRSVSARHFHAYFPPPRLLGSQ